MDEPIKWLEVAREWRRMLKETGPEQGRREPTIRDFAAAKDINPSSVRRCDSVLRFAEALKKANKIDSVDQLAKTSLENLFLLQRVGRLSMEQAAALLPEVQSGRHTVRELRAIEARLREDLAEKAAAHPGANLIVHRFSAPLFKDRAIAAYQANAKALGGQVLRLTGRGAFLDTSHVLVRFKHDGRFRAARMIPAPGLTPFPGRHVAIATLAATVARIVHQVDVVTQSSDDGEGVAASLRTLGPCGAGVLTLTDDGSLQAIHTPQRVQLPDLLATHLRALEARFPTEPEAPAPGATNTSGEHLPTARWEGTRMGRRSRQRQDVQD